MIMLRVPQENIQSRELFVAHSDLSLGRGLEPGERIVVQDARAGGAYAATVVGVDFLVDDTVYRLNLRGRLPHGVAAQVPAPAETDRVDLVDVQGLLGELKSELAPADSVTAGV
jgi:hypothetical protein